MADDYLNEILIVFFTFRHQKLLNLSEIRLTVIRGTKSVICMKGTGTETS